MATTPQPGRILDIDLRGHVFKAGAFALVASLLLVGLAWFFGARGPILWIIAGHQLVANTVMLGWIAYVSEDEADDESGGEP
jgi:hypothetical protein